MQKHLRQRVSLLNFQHLTALGFGSGLSPVMPGTAGTIVGLPIVWLMSFTSWPIYIVITIAAFVLGIKVCQTTSDALQAHDHGSIVWDEIAGLMVAFILVPVSWLTLLLGFVLFRLFDIAKPWPISSIDKRVHGGFGIMIDDIVAGIITCVILHLSLPYISAFTA